MYMASALQFRVTRKGYIRETRDFKHGRPTKFTYYLQIQTHTKMAKIETFLYNYKSHSEKEYFVLILGARL
jgi:hypothetical protein